jgi:hypothetical protein
MGAENLAVAFCRCSSTAGAGEIDVFTAGGSNDRPGSPAVPAVLSSLLKHGGGRAGTAGTARMGMGLPSNLGSGEVISLRCSFSDCKQTRITSLFQ